MKLFKKFGYFALAAALCLGFASCSDDGEENKVLLKNVDVSFTVVPSTDYTDVFDLSATAGGDTSKAQNVFSNWYGDNLVVDVEYLTCPSTISVKVQRKKKSSFVPDETKQYDMSYTVKTVINKYYNDGTSKKVVLDDVKEGGTVRLGKMTQWLEVAQDRVDEPIKINFDADGNI